MIYNPEVKAEDVMKNLKNSFKSLAILFAMSVLLTACGGSDSFLPVIAVSSPTITSFTPSQGPIGTTVTITGTKFSTTAADNIVRFNGQNAIVTSSTSTQIVTIVPTGATTGPITVTVGILTGTSPINFTVTAAAAPTIASFTPSQGPVGTTVTITGTNFSTTPASNVVMFNGTTAVVTSSTATQIVTTVPTGATTGTITVAVGGLTGTSPSSFTVPAGGGVPGAPTNVVATPGTNSVTITWPAVTGATSYRIYFSTATGVTPATGTLVTVPQPTVAVTSPYRHSRLTTTPTWLAANTTYYYIVTAVNASGEGPASTEVPALTSAVDGVTLYGTNCQNCHNALASSNQEHVGASAAQIQTGINNNSGGMGSLTLTTAEVSAISDVMAAGF